MRAVFFLSLFCSLLYPQSLEESLAYSKCAIYVCWIYGWRGGMDWRKGIQFFSFFLVCPCKFTYLSWFKELRNNCVVTVMGKRLPLLSFLLAWRALCGIQFIQQIETCQLFDNVTNDYETVLPFKVYLSCSLCLIKYFDDPRVLGM